VETIEASIVEDSIEEAFKEAIKEEMEDEGREYDGGVGRPPTCFNYGDIGHLL
jgi:hypothetical protein